MRCFSSVIGIAVIALGVGILIGGILPSWVAVSLLGIILIIIGFYLLNRY